MQFEHLQQQLGLDEALISVNNTLANKDVKLLYQLEECQGCPLATIKRIPRLSTYDIKVTTKYQINLELRDNDTHGYICNWHETFNDRGHYALDIIKTPSGKSCTFSVLDEGNCQICPIGVLAIAIFTLSLLEIIFKFVYDRRILKKASDVVVGSDSMDINNGNDDRQQNGKQQKDEVGIKYVIDSQMAPQEVVSRPLDLEEINRTGPINMDQSRSEETANTNNRLSSRVESLDIFRGLTIAGMIFVNYGGAGYTFFEHSVWDGITLADLVFPFFIFILGFSVPISIRSPMKRNVPSYKILWRILKRSLLLLLIGLCLNSISLNNGDINNLRIPGVLQRFSISYLVVAITYYISLICQRKLNQYFPGQISKWEILIASFEIFVSLGCIGLYLYYTFFWEYDPACPIGYTGPGGISDEGRYYNCTGGAASYIDRYFLGENHLYHDHEVKDMYLTNISHDPEGILGCSMSILLAMIGLQCGKTLVGYKSHRDRLSNWSHWILITNNLQFFTLRYQTVGLLCGSLFFIPINKRLWSLTYVAVSALSANIVYFVFYILIDVIKFRRTLLIRLLSSAGKNPLFLYIGHSMCSTMIPWYFAVDENSHGWLLARLTWATTLWLLTAHWMASRSIVIKI